jgi:hypothetical protein
MLLFIMLKSFINGHSHNLERILVDSVSHSCEQFDIVLAHVLRSKVVSIKKVENTQRDQNVKTNH